MCYIFVDCCWCNVGVCENVILCCYLSPLLCHWCGFVYFQVEESKFVFEAKTIQRMELLVLSTLQWKMNPVTPLSFIDHIIRRLGWKTRLHWEFLWKCERLLLCVISGKQINKFSIHYLQWMNIHYQNKHNEDFHISYLVLGLLSYIQHWIQIQAVCVIIHLW